MKLIFFLRIFQYFFLVPHVITLMPFIQEFCCFKVTAFLLMQPKKGNLSDVTNIWAIALNIKTRADI